MKTNRGFSLAEILMTIFVTGIIAGVSLSFFKHNEPDIRIYNSTVEQLQLATATVSQMACSDTFICATAPSVPNNPVTNIAPPICPDFAPGDTPVFSDNTCSHAQNAAAPFCNTPYILTNGRCEAVPICNNPPATLYRYRDLYCEDGTPELNQTDDIGGGNNITFFCEHMYEILQKTSTVKFPLQPVNDACASNNTALPILLTNRARIYGLNDMPPIPAGAAGNQPAMLVVKFDNTNDLLFTGGDLASLSSDRASLVFIYPNGKVISRESILEKLQQSMSEAQVNLANATSEQTAAQNNYDNCSANNCSELAQYQAALDEANSAYNDADAKNTNATKSYTDFKNNLSSTNPNSIPEQLVSAPAQGTYTFVPYNNRGGGLKNEFTDILNSVTDTCGADGSQCKSPSVKDPTKDTEPYMQLNEYTSNPA